MIDLPDEPGPVSATPALLDFGAFLTPPLGGPLQRIDRLGGRFRISVSMPPLRGAQGRVWVSRLIRGKSEGVRMPLPLQGFDPGAPGSPVVDTAGQAGSTLKLRGCTPNYIFREGQFFSVVTGGRHHLISVAAETIAGSDGKVTLPIHPLIRVQHLDGDVVHVGKPMIEGFVVGEELAWEMQLAGFVGLSFELQEAA